MFYSIFLFYPSITHQEGLEALERALEKCEYKSTVSTERLQKIFEYVLGNVHELDNQFFKTKFFKTKIFLELA